MGNVITTEDGKLKYSLDDPNNNLLTKFIHDWSINNYTVNNDVNNINLNTDVLKKRACCTRSTHVGIDFPVYNDNYHATYKGQIYLPLKDVNNPLLNNIINTATVSIHLFADTPTKSDCNLSTNILNERDIYNYDPSNGGKASNACVNFYSNKTSKTNFCKEIRKIRGFNIIPLDPKAQYDVNIYGPNINLDTTGIYNDSYQDCVCENSYYKLHPEDFKTLNKVTGKLTDEVNPNALAQNIDTLCMQGLTNNYAYIPSNDEKTSMCVNYIGPLNANITNNGILNQKQSCDMQVNNTTSQQTNTTPSSLSPKNTTPSSVLPKNTTPSSVLPKNTTPPSLSPKKTTPSSVLPKKTTPSSVLPKKTKNPNLETSNSSNQSNSSNPLNPLNSNQGTSNMEADHSSSNNNKTNSILIFFILLICLCLICAIGAYIFHIYTKSSDNNWDNNWDEN